MKKGYEKKAIEKELIKAKNMLGYFNGRLNAFDTQMAMDTRAFEKRKEEYNTLTTKLQLRVKERVEQISNLEAKLLTLGKKPEKQPNGKVICQYCGKEFSPQGIASHENACKKTFDKDAEIAKLKAKMEELQKEELIPVEIPEVKEIPLPELKPDLTLEEIKDGREMLHQANNVLAEKEAELEKKEGE